MKEKFNGYLFRGSAIIVLLSASLYILLPDIMRYVFAVGAAGMAISRLSERYEGTNLRIRRLSRLQKLAALLIVGASYFMFKPFNQWVPLLLIAAFLELYTSWMIDREEKKTYDN